MRDMNLNKRIEIRPWMLVLLFASWNSFFNYRPMVDFGKWWTLMNLTLLALFIILLSKILRNIRKNDIMGTVSKILIMFVFSILWSFLFWDQNIIVSIMQLCSTMNGVFPLAIFFFLLYFRVTKQTVIKAIIALCIIYSICLLIGQMTFPDQLFGYKGREMNEYTLETFEQRGILRILVPGSDFVVICIFLVLSHFYKKKQYYILLIPLFAILFLRGTRTPLFVTFFICLSYLVLRVRYKLISVILAVLLFVVVSVSYNSMLESNSKAILVRYVQITNEQIEKNQVEKEDIRLQMADYMFRKFNGDNVAAIIFGNGIYGGDSRYQIKMEKLQKGMNYHVVDSGITNIFISFGIVGLVLYFILLIQVVRVSVPENDIFAKLYVFYLYLILPTNTIMLTSSSFILALALYVIYRGSRENKRNIIHLNNENHHSIVMSCK